MENLKIQIKIEDNDDIKEAHDLLLKLGFSTYSKESFDVWINQPKPIWLKTNCFDEQPNKIDWCLKESHGECKEITLPELRDLVVLKRNDRNDRTHTDQDNWSWFISSNGTGYVFGAGNANGLHQWDESSLNMVDLKPIEKPMKEYLIKSGDGKYLLTRHGSIGAIEIPDGAEIYIDLGFGNHSFYKDNFKLCWCGVRWENTVHNSVNLEHWNNTPVLWKRANQPEELPFVDDEPKIETATGYQLDVVGSNTYGSRSRYDGESDISYRQYLMNFIVGNRTESLNDQYAEIETVRQSAWQKQEGGSHYKNLKIQPMQYALENKLDYAQANVVKYVTRHKEKNGKEDLLKAIHNLELMIEFYYGDEK